jgi:CheY-like chemotaxis protein
MAVSDRQVRRLEHTAIRALAAHLAALYALRVTAEDGDEPQAAQGSEMATTAHEQELDWLRKSYTPESADVYQLVESALKTAEPMLARAGGSAACDLPPDLPPVSGQATTLRQILLNLLLAAAGAGINPRVRITGSALGRMMTLTLTTEYQNPSSSLSKDTGEFMGLAQQLAELSGGGVHQILGSKGGVFETRLELPVIEAIPILIVDDNEDSLRLFERSLQSSRFQYLGTRDPLRVASLAEENNARAIILDIMLPEIDGWELLGRLRTHPTLGGIPVIISTILPHEQLAISLGAAGFLRKPVNREALIDLLNRLVG